jgi:hypothetical protein
MADIFTAAELDEQIAAWKQALLALATHQEYWLGTRRIRRADLPEVRQTLRDLAEQKAALTGQSGCRRVHTTPVGDSW